MDRSALRTRARRAAVEDCFQFLGLVKDMPSLLAESDLVVAPSISGDIPLVVLEACAVGRPAVCSRVGAIEESPQRGGRHAD